MGEAARRKKLDSSYGKIPRLSTNSLKFKETEKIIQELFKEFKSTLNELMKAESIPETYQSDSEKIKQWVDQRLLKYHEQDRSTLAVAIFAFITSLGSGDLLEQLGYRTEISPLLLTCFVKIVKNYLSREESEKLLLSFQKSRERAKTLEPNFDLDSIFEETERELQLVLNYPANDENWVFTSASDQVAIGDLNDCLHMAGLTTTEQYKSTYVDPLLEGNLSEKEKSALVNEAYLGRVSIQDELYDKFFNKAVREGEIYIHKNIEKNLDRNEESKISCNHIMYNPERAEHFRNYGF